MIVFYGRWEGRAGKKWCERLEGAAWRGTARQGGCPWPVIIPDCPPVVTLAALLMREVCGLGLPRVYVLTSLTY